MLTTKPDKASGQNDIDVGEKKGRWTKCGGPSSLTFFQFIFLLEFLLNFGHALFPFSFFLRTFRVVELLARAKEKANREATRLQAERKIPEWLKLEFAKFSLLTAWVDELFFLSNFEFRNNAVCEKGG